MACYTGANHTFVICAYKENPFLEETILSLLNQTVKSNIIMSTSTPNPHIEGLSTKYNIPLIVNSEPRLAGDDWNFGFNAANTELVTIAHQDDCYEPSFTQKVIEVANKYSNEVLLFYTDYYEIRNNQRIESSLLLNTKRFLNAPLSKRAMNNSKGLQRRILSVGDPICCPSVTLCKNKVGMSVFDTTYKNSCDYKTWVNLTYIEGRFVYIPHILMGHRIYEESATSKNLGENIRKAEDLEILSTLWPKIIARCINRVYAISEKNNNL